MKFATLFTVIGMTSVVHTVINPIMARVTVHAMHIAQS